MPRKVRDYKAEYARRKAAAVKRGYTSPRQEYKVRRTLNLPRTRRSPARRAAERYLPDIKDIIAPGELGRLRRESAAWSKTHSRNNKSAYDPDMTGEQVRAYHNAFVKKPVGGSRRKNAKAKRARIKAYVMEYTGMSEEEWSEKYELIPVG